MAEISQGEENEENRSIRLTIELIVVESQSSSIRAKEDSSSLSIDNTA
jgi:hypothetical protein